LVKLAVVHVVYRLLIRSEMNNELEKISL
jgi:hypothetical protein